MTNKQGKAIESTAAYSMPGWKTVLNNTTFTVGVNNIFGRGSALGDWIRI